MPIVGNKKYPYTKVGIKKAKKHAETTGQKMVKKYKSGGRVVPSSAETSVIRGATVRGSREGSTLKGPKAKGSREGSIIKAKGGRWIQDAIKKPGALRSSLGIKKGKTIPAKTLAKASKAKGKLGQRARLAETLKGFHKG
jgi:hypothetical protein